jgi:hypothetical protein
VQQPSDEGASRGADVGRDAIFVALDLLVGVLQAVSLKGGLPNQECVPMEMRSQHDALYCSLLMDRCVHVHVCVCALAFQLCL